MATPRGGLPWIWVSWLVGILSADQQCVFASHYKAHFRYTKRPDPTFDLAAWSADHAALIERRRQELVRDGWRVTVENENAFRLKGASAIVAGKPDLIAVRGRTVRIVDGKTGQQKARDWHQVLIYMFAVPRLWPEYAQFTIEGEVCYRSGPVAIGPHELTRERIAAIGEAVKAVAASDAPAPVPSAAECSRCDLADCTVRIETDVAETLVSEF